MKFTANNKKWFTAFFLYVAFAWLTGCDSSEDAAPEQVVENQPEVSFSKPPLISAYSLQAYNLYSNSLAAAQDLQNKISDLLNSPDPVKLEACQVAWVQAYNQFLKTGPFNHLGVRDPFELIEQKLDFPRILDQLNSWPIQGGYIDYVSGYPFSGIVNDLAIKIDRSTLIKQHGFADPSYASLGFHPLKFMLFGENGKRSAKDFIPKENTMDVLAGQDNQIVNEEDIPLGENTLNSNEGNQALSQNIQEPASTIKPQNNNRRRQYVRILSEQIVVNLQYLQERWQPAHGIYARQLTANPEDKVLRAIFISIRNALNEDIISRHLFPIIKGEDYEDSHNTFTDVHVAKQLESMVKSLSQIYLNFDDVASSPLTPDSLHQVFAEEDQEGANNLKLSLDSALKTIEALKSIKLKQDDRMKLYQSLLTELQQVDERLVSMGTKLQLDPGGFPISKD